MKKKFRPWRVDQVRPLPAAVQDFVPPGHSAHFIRDLVSERLDLSAIMKTYRETRGYPPYDPRMMTAGYSRGVYSSRKLAQACQERMDFMAVTALDQPDFRTIAEFRKRHLLALAGLFKQVLRLCQEAGLVQLGHVVLNGTKTKANASRHKAMTYGRMKTAQHDLSAQVSDWLEAASKADAQEDADYGASRRGDEMPDWMADKQRRLEKITEAKVALEAQARAETEDPPPKGCGGGPPKSPPAVPKDSAQRNFTDPQSSIMKGRDGFIEGYNAQAAVDEPHQVIVAQGLSANGSDQGQLAPMVDAIKTWAGHHPRELSADTGYCSESNLRALEDRGIRGYIATGRQKHPAGGKAQKGGPLAQAMRQRLRLGGHRSHWRSSAPSALN